jgi:hypothetical protein
MQRFDVFNGDADGICALQQLRLAEPVESTLVTGVKRDIALLKQVQASAGDTVTVLDISLDKNREALEQLVGGGVQVHYFDHHYAGAIPAHPNLGTSIDTTPDTCTSLLVDRYLEGQYRAWAVVGAFGDNLDQRARAAAEPVGLADSEVGRLRELGIYINYNSYGGTVQDLHFAPDELFRRLHPHESPLTFIAEDEAFERLRDGYVDDNARVSAVRPALKTDRRALYVLPAAPWARRVSGVFANRLAQDAPARAHALLTQLPEGGYMVSVRAPLETRVGADELCRQFPSGGGRKAAAGINQLPEERFDDFVGKFEQAFD